MRVRVLAALVLTAVLAVGGCLLSRSEKEFAEDRAQWQALAIRYLTCIGTGSIASCRADVERDEWSPITPETATRAELQGIIAPGGTIYPSPGKAPEGDFCLSHDDIDFNFNVIPDPAFASLLQPGNFIADADHPSGGVIEGEWESFYLDPAYVAKPAGAGASYKTWASPQVDMRDGDRVAGRGAGVLDKGHKPYRGELHPPYLLLWGGRRGESLVVHARASALLARPSDFQALPDPPEASEALHARFRMPPAFCLGGAAPSIAVTQSIEYFFNAPSIVVDQGCDLANGVSLTDLEGPEFDAALSSPAAHLVGANTTSGAAAFFTIGVETSSASIDVTLTPISRPHQALYGAKITAAWACP